MTRVLAKAPRGTKRKFELKVSAGRVRVSATGVVFRGRVYAATVSRAVFTVRAGQKATVTVRFSPLAIASSLSATSVARNRIALQWAAPDHAQVRLRRAVGSEAPGSVHQGTAVKVAGSSAVDGGLSPARQYSYALFTRFKHGWSTPVTITVGTAPSAGSMAAAYVAPPSTVIVRPGESDVPSVSHGVVSVRLASGQATPVIGAGFVLPISTTLRAGYLGKVSSISADGRTVTLAPAGLADAFDYYSLDADLAKAGPGTIVARAAASAAHDDTGTTGGEGPTPPTPPAPPTPGCNASAGDQINLGLPTFSPSGHFGILLHHFLGATTSATINAGIQLATHLPVSVNISGAVTCNYPLAYYYVEIPTEPVPLGLKFDVDATASATGAIDDSGIAVDSVSGFSGSVLMTPIGSVPTGFSSIFSGGLSDSGASTITAALSFGIGGTLTFGPGIGDDAAGALAGISATLTPIQASYMPVQSQTGGGCVSVELGGSVTAGLTAQAWLGAFSVSHTVNVVNASRTYLGPEFLPTGCNAPVTVTNPGDQTSYIGSQVSLPIKATAPDSGTLSYAAKGLPSGLSIDGGSGVITGSPTTAGTYSVEIDVKDSTGLVGSTTFTWTIPNLSATNPGDQHTEVNTSVSLQVQASDTDPNAVVTYTASGLPPGLVIDPGTGTISGTPTTVGKYAVVVTVQDSDGTAIPLSFTWLIENPPNYGHWVGSIRFSIDEGRAGTPGDEESSQQDLSYELDTGGDPIAGTPLVRQNVAASNSLLWSMQNTYSEGVDTHYPYESSAVNCVATYTDGPRQPIGDPQSTGDVYLDDDGFFVIASAESPDATYPGQYTINAGQWVSYETTITANESNTPGCPDSGSTTNSIPDRASSGFGPQPNLYGADPEHLQGTSTQSCDASTQDCGGPSYTTTDTWDLHLVGVADTDGDGADDYVEFINGTDPLNPASTPSPGSPGVP